MTDFLGGAFDAIGKAAAPIKPALDFLMPDTGQQSDGFSIGNLINSAGQGLQNAFDEGLAGLGAVGYNAVTGQGTARERLLMGGMALAGTAMSARALHAGWKANRPVSAMRAMPAPGGYDKLTKRLGDPERFMDLTPDAQALMRAKPGINRRQAQILSSDEGVSVARGFGRWADDDKLNMNAGAGLFNTYAARVPEQARGAQVDWARFELASSQNIFGGSGKSNVRVRELWSRATKNPASLQEPEAEELFGYIQAFADKTDIQVADDLSVGLAGRVVRADFVEGDPHIFVSHPPAWDDGMVVDPLVRAKRLSQLNHRALADHGKGMLRKIYLLGEKEFDAFAADGTTALPKGLELGPNWYPRALEDVAREFDIDPNVDPAALDRAVAAVSFLSEAENWDTNIVKARKVLQHAGDISDEDFQQWLRDKVEIDTSNPKLGRHEYAGKRTAAKAHEKRFKEIWETVKKGPEGEKGFKVDEVTMKKILRLYGGVESVDEVFRTTVARKQRNFFLNIRHPDDVYPVTIDRHAYDAFFGLDSGIQDRPIDQSLFDGDQVYDTIADTYRALAAELSEERGRLVRPHEVQAVIWETWRMLKTADGARGGWNRVTEDNFEFPDPFMVLSPDSTSNIVYDALIGRAGLTGAIGDDVTGPIPLSLLDAKDVNGLTAVAVGEETVILADASDWVATRVRTKTPGVKGSDGIFRWVDSSAKRVKDIQSHLDTTNQDVHFSEVSLVSDHPGGVHPMFRNNDVIVGYVEDGKKLRAPRGAGKMSRAGRTVTSSQGLSYEKLGPDDIDPAKWGKPGSPIDTHAWAAVSAELTPEQVTGLGLGAHNNEFATNRLRAELQRRGFKPIDQEGYYGTDVPETSFLVFGITPQEAREIGEMFYQNSVITNDGFLYNRTRTNNPEDLGRRREALGLEKDPQPIDGEDFYRSELVIGGKRLKWRQDLNWDQTEDVLDEQLVQRKSATRQRIEIDVKPGQDLSQLADELEARGLQDLSIYASTDRLDGFERAYENVVSDGHSFATTRTRKGAVTSAHGSHVFTRSASGLPDSVPSQSTSWSVRGDGVAVAGNSLLVDGRFPTGTVEFTGPFQAKLNGQSPIAWGYTDGILTPIFDEAELNSGRFEATVKKGQITPADPNDIRGAIAAHQALVDAGYPELAIPTAKGKPGKMTLKGPNGTFDFGVAKETKAAADLVTTKNGLLVQPTHRDGMVKPFEEKYGIEFSAGWRQDDNKHLILPDRVIAQVDDGFAVVMDKHAPMIHRARLRGVSTESIPKAEWDENQTAYAKFPWRADSEIVLTREWFNDPRAFERSLREARSWDERWLSPRVEPTPTGIVVHELGHAMHMAARLGEGMKKSSDLDKEIIALLGGGRTWKKVAAKEISKTAAIEVSELIAESVSEVLLSPSPSGLAKDVYAILVDRMSGYMQYRDLTA